MRITTLGAVFAAATAAGFIAMLSSPSLAQAPAPAGAQAPAPAGAQAPAPAGAQPPAPATGDAAAGQRKTSMCAGCHGIVGWRTAYPEVYGVPKIGGQHPAYIVKALQAYKNGDRGHPTMKAIAASLSDKDMADLAAYYGGGPTQTASK